MSHETQRHEITKKRVLYQIPGMEAVTIRRDVEYLVTDESTLTIDIYYPPEAQSGGRAPVGPERRWPARKLIAPASLNEFAPPGQL